MNISNIEEHLKNMESENYYINMVSLDQNEKENDQFIFFNESGEIDGKERLLYIKLKSEKESKKTLVAG